MNEHERRTQIKLILKDIKKSNIAVRGFMRSNKYRKGSYRTLQRTQIWTIAKRQLLKYYTLKQIPLVCFKCNQEIRGGATLHHKKYNWKKLFSPRYITFCHKNCHEVVHTGKRGYKSNKLAFTP